MNPRLSVADILVKNERLVLGENADSINTGVGTVRQREIYKAILAAVGNSRLSYIFSKRIKSAALTASKEHGYDFFLSVHNIPPVLCQWIYLFSAEAFLRLTGAFVFFVSAFAAAFFLAGAALRYITERGASVSEMLSSKPCIAISSDL